jgi:phage shock protein A
MALRKRTPDAAEPAPGEPRFTPKRAKNALAVAKIVGPAVIPVVTPFVIRAFGEARDRIDRMKARRLGVAVGDLAQYSGKGGALHARITGAAEAIAELRDRRDATADDRTFADRSETTLRQLAAAVRAAERMPSARRKAAHKAAATELDELEQRVLTRLGL